MPQRAQSKSITGRNKKPPGTFQLKSKWNRRHLILLIILSILGAYLRMEPAIFDTVHFSYDQGIDISYVRKLIVEHKLGLIGRFTGLEGVFMGPLWTWILAIPYVVSGGSPAANVIFLSILGIIAIWLTYLLVRRMLSESVAMLAAFYVALSGTFIAASHIVMSPYPLTILMIPYLWFLWEIIEHGNEKFWPWLGLFAGLFFQFEIGFAIFLVPATLLLLGVFKRNKLLQKPALLGFALFSATFLPQVLFELRHDFLMTKAVIRFFSGENISLGSEQAHLLGRLFIRLGSLWEDYSSSVGLGERNTVLALLITIPAILGWRKAKIRKDKETIRVGYILLLIIIVMYAGFTLFPAPVWVWYRAGLPIVFILLAAIGWAELMGKNELIKWLVIISLTSVVVLRIIPGTLIAKSGDYKGGPATLRNQKRALDLIFQDAGDEPFDLYVYTPPVYTYVWDHMLFWYAKPNYANYPADYGYQRSTHATNDFYLLIEPDDIQARIDGWKGNFVSFAEVVEHWAAPGGMQIEKWEAKKQ